MATKYKQNSSDAVLLIVHKLHVHCWWVSLIAGLEYGMKQWNRKWNGTVNVLVTANSCSCMALFFKVELATMCLGHLSHCRGCMSKSSYSTMHGSHAHHCHGRLLLRLWDSGVTKNRLRCTDEDQNKETENRALISAITFFFLSMKTITIVLWSQTLVFRSRVWLCKTTITKHLMMSQQWYHAWI